MKNVLLSINVGEESRGERKLVTDTCKQKKIFRQPTFRKTILPPSSGLKMEAVCLRLKMGIVSSGMLVSTYKSI
jgi:hypothetical protein